MQIKHVQFGTMISFVTSEIFVINKHSLPASHCLIYLIQLQL
jgi:hypothetical protein